MKDGSLCAVDSSTLINFLLLDRLDLLAEPGSLRLVVPEEVVGEIRRKDQARKLRETIACGMVQQVQLEGLQEVVTYQQLSRRIQPGESACLSLAHHRGWLIACDEKRGFLREMKRLLGKSRLLTTASVLLLAIRRGKLTVEEADDLKSQLERHRFRMKFASFGDLLWR